ncbi:MAG: hypothetical protein HKL85_06745 [Acidimicrobiaceae bacterium]|nr:hypothetical protein [Acidimicrobiaceae bacterium]
MVHAREVAKFFGTRGAPYALAQFVVFRPAVAPFVNFGHSSGSYASARNSFTQNSRSTRRERRDHHPRIAI